MSKQETIVVDIGSGFCKGGVSGEDIPRIIYPTVVTTPTVHPETGAQTADLKYGNDALSSSEKVNYPICYGVVDDERWTDLENMCDHIFQEKLKLSPADNRVFMTESPLNPKGKRERMTQMMFESFGTPAFYTGIQAVMSLYASGRTTGFVLDSGHEVTFSVPIYEGYALSHAIRRFNYAGRDITTFLKRSVSEGGRVALTLHDACIIKEKYCYVAPDYDIEMSTASTCSSSEEESMYTLPDGQVLNLGQERFLSPEILFHPHLVGMDTQGIDREMFYSLTMCDVDIRRDLFSNIVLAGGTTMLPGFHHRILKEIKALAQPSLSIDVIAPSERKLSAWIGASILSSLDTFEEMWITKAEYEEHGPAIVQKKCC